MPFRVFAAGEVLTAANVNDYLAEQAIATFAGTAARASAITAPTEGQFAYLSDSDSLTFYNGSAWVNAGSAIAGTALSSGTATSGQVLTANGSGAVTFSTPSSGLTFISSTTIGNSVSSVSLPANTFTSTYDSYRVIWDASTATACSSTAIRFRFRASGTDNSTATSYNHTGYFANPTTLSINNDSSTWSFCGSILDATPERYMAVFDISGIALAKETKFMCTAVGMDGGTRRNIMTIGFHTVQTAYDSMSFILDSGTMSGGKIKVYGYAN